MDFTLDISLIVNSLTVAALMFVAKFLWQVSTALKSIQATQASHEVLDQTRFEALHARVDDLRSEVRNEFRGIR